MRVRVMRRGSVRRQSPPRSRLGSHSCKVALWSHCSIAMNDDDDTLDTHQWTALDTEVLPYDDGLETVQEAALPAEDEDPTTQVSISGEIG